MTPIPPAAAVAFTITVTAEHVVLGVHGTLDAATVGDFVSRLDREMSLLPRALIIDLSETHLIADRAIGALVRVAAQARCGGIALAIVTGQCPARSSLEELGTDAALPLYRRLDDEQNGPAILPSQRHRETATP